MLTAVNERAAIRELVGRFPQTCAIFETYGIDYCCGGQKTLADAASERQASVQELIAALEAAVKAPSDSSVAVTDWFDAPMRELVAHIVTVHHAYLKSALPRIDGLLGKVLHAHGAQHGDMLRELHSQFSLLENELTGHMAKEEMILFPYVVAAEACRRGSGPPPSGCFGTVRNPIRQMEAEHEVAGKALRQIRKVTGVYAAPSDACPTFRTLFEELEHLEGDLHEHIHLENNILFPRTIELESNPKDQCRRAPAAP